MKTDEVETVKHFLFNLEIFWNVVKIDFVWVGENFDTDVENVRKF